MHKLPAYTSLALALAFAVLSSPAILFAQAQTTSKATSTASPVPIGILENLYVFFAVLGVAIGILIVAATALVIRRKIA